MIQILAGFGFGFSLALIIGYFFWRQFFQSSLSQREQMLGKREADVAQKDLELDTELNRIRSLSEGEVRDAIVKAAEDSASAEVERFQEEARAEAELKARLIILNAMERTATKFVTEATTTVIDLPSPDIKGRIIGREGRNIKAFEHVTGVEVIVDDAPETVTLSCFDPLRREVARMTLMKLIEDGRFNPARIEELFAECSQVLEKETVQAGKKAAQAAGVGKLSPKVVQALGRLRFRTSLAQNVLDHSVETAQIAQLIAQELGVSVPVAKRAALLHDIGKALGPEFEGPHAIAGMNFLKAEGEDDRILNAVGAHHHDIAPNCSEAQLVIVADSISASRPGARREGVENYIQRLTALESIANSLLGVERSFALQAGREIRLMIKPDEVDDDGARRIGQQVARMIEQDAQFSVPVKVTVIREMRASVTTKKG